ncbi:MAG TPA: serine acetyltransferase [Candidatus Eisenbacteria bacterium]|nr:serine acetyltransferase [Candidatus Eisenbacteria bacterium]
MFDNLRADIREARKINVGPSWTEQHIKVWLQPGMVAVVCYRYRNWTTRVRVPVVRQLLSAVGLVAGYWTAALTGVDISPLAQIGPGFVVHTAHGVLVGKVVMGSNCIVQMGVALTYGTGRVGNNVYFGPGAKVIGHAKIGNNVVVVANSLVMTDVPDNTTVMGVPARIRLPRGRDDGGRSITRVVSQRIGSDGQVSGPRSSGESPVVQS